MVWWNILPPSLGKNIDNGGSMFLLHVCIVLSLGHVVSITHKPTILCCKPTIGQC
jgi:hypothetical protein